MSEWDEERWRDEVEPSLYERRSAEYDTVLERLREIETRIASIESRLESGETHVVGEDLEAALEAMGREVEDMARTRF